MIELNKVENSELLKVKGLQDVFPFAARYISSPEYQQQKYEWYYITDNGFNTPEERSTWIGLICVTDDKYIYGDNLHLSVLEVATPIRGLSIGTRIVDRLIDIARENEYKILTLHMKEDSLIGFYSRFGFKKMIAKGGVELYALEV